jgi:hypothetical protein
MAVGDKIEEGIEAITSKGTGKDLPFLLPDTVTQIDLTRETRVRSAYKRWVCAHIMCVKGIKCESERSGCLMMYLYASITNM